MPIYKAKKFDNAKIQEIIRVHPHMHFEIGMKEDWEFVHEEITNPKQDSALGIDSTWWDTPVLRIYDSNNQLIKELEVWKEIEYETTEETYNLHKELLIEMKKRRKEML